MKGVALAPIFAAHARQPPAVLEPAELEEALRALVQRATAAWPSISLPPERLVAFVARHLPRCSAHADLAALHAHHLHLVCAYGLGVAAAQEVIETEHLRRVARALQRVGCAPSAAADILQDLRCRLVEMQDPAVRRRGYSGRSDLSGWLCLSALRAAGLHRRRDQRERPLEDHAAVLLARGADPETEALRERFKDLFQAAFREAIAALDSRERNLLRYHYLSRLSIDQIAQLHDIHRATAARRLARAEERLVELTRARFLSRVPMGALTMDQIPALIHSRISLDLRRMLQV